MWSIGIRQKGFLYVRSVFRWQETQVLAKIACLGFDHVCTRCAVGARSSLGLAVLLFQDTMGSNEVIYADVVFP